MDNNLITSLKDALVTLGIGEDDDYTTKSLVKTLKEFAVVTGSAEDISDIESNSAVGVLKYITENGENIIDISDDNGNFSTVKVTIVANNFQPIIYAPYIAKTNEEEYAESKITNSGTYDIILYKGYAVINYNHKDYTATVTSGEAYLGNGFIEISTPCTLEFLENMM